MNSYFDVIIIGGGLGGLTAGAMLTKHGKKVLLLEQHYIPGGCATTFKRKDYIMEVGLHELDGLDEKDSKQEIFKFLEIDKHINFLPAAELYRYKSKDTDFVFPHGVDEIVNALIEKFPEEEIGIRNYVKFMDSVLSEISRLPEEWWKKILLFPFMPLLYKNVVKASTTNLGDWLDKHINSDELKLILLGNLVYYHDDPYSMSLFYYIAAQSSYMNGGGHFIQGGSQQLSNYLAKVIEDNGGQVLLGKKATRILVDGGKANGVVYKDSFNNELSEVTVNSDRIIANLAIPLVVDLLPDIESKKLSNKIKDLETACSLISVYIGFKKAPKLLGNRHYSTILVGDDVKSIADFNANCNASWEDRNFAFVDYSQVDSRLAPEGKGFGAICAADYLSNWDKLDEDSYAKKKEEVAQVFIKRLEKLIPGISEQVEYYEVGTPKTIQRYILSPDGTAYGFAQTPKQAGNKRIPLKSPVKNLYFAGAWTFPGGGFTGAILSGFLCGNQVNNTLLNKKSAEPQRIKDHRITKLIETRDIADNTIELVIEKPKGLTYAAGQYVVLELINPKYNTLDMPFRPLSMVSHPDEDVVRFAMRLSNSSFKKSCNALEKGDKLRLFGPMGHFSVSTENRGVVFLISGIGITPIISLLKELEKIKFTQPVYLFYTNRSEEVTSYHKLLQNITIQNYKYVPVFTRTDKRINDQFLESKLGSFEPFDYYLVGNNKFIGSMRSLLLAKNVNKEQIIVDDFG